MQAKRVLNLCLGLEQTQYKYTTSLLLETRKPAMKLLANPEFKQHFMAPQAQIDAAILENP